MIQRNKPLPHGWWLFGFFALVTAIIYSAGLHGGFLFDDYPNILDNKGVQPSDASLASLTRVALSSPASEFKRPLASLSFAANYLTTGLDPYWMKLTNLIIHLANGLLVFVLARKLINLAHSEELPPDSRHTDISSALVAGGWLLLPINLTAVLYVVQRMESLANLFVLLGLLGYLVGRQSMLRQPVDRDHSANSTYRKGFILCIASIVLCTGIGSLAKETAVAIPLYAAIIEWTILRPRMPRGRFDYGISALFALTLLAPMIIGLSAILPNLLKPETWSYRNFTMQTRLLSEARAVVDYIAWTLTPTFHSLSFYHDDFEVSKGLLTPWTTLASIAALTGIVLLAIWTRRHRPLISLGIQLYLGAHLLTATIIPLELIYEHRNYFASFGLLLAVIPALIGRYPIGSAHWQKAASALSVEDLSGNEHGTALKLPRYVLAAGAIVLWGSSTFLTAKAWNDPLQLAEELAYRAPSSPRAQYELGRTYIVYSQYDPASPFTKLAYPALERAASLPESSILPEQALIFMNARMNLPIKDSWWDTMIGKLKARKPGIQDESSLNALIACSRERHCDLPKAKMVAAFTAALTHPNPSPRLLALYGDYAWTNLEDQALGKLLMDEAVAAAPRESAYRITLTRMLINLGEFAQAREQIKVLEQQNINGNLQESINSLKSSLGSHP